MSLDLKRALSIRIENMCISCPTSSGRYSKTKVRPQFGSDELTDRQHNSQSLWSRLNFIWTTVWSEISFVWLSVLTIFNYSGSKLGLGKCYVCILVQNITVHLGSGGYFIRKRAYHYFVTKASIVDVIIMDNICIGLVTSWMLNECFKLITHVNRINGYTTFGMNSAHLAHWHIYPLWLTLSLRIYSQKVI